VRISEKGVSVLTEPTVEYCPLHESLYGTRSIDTQAVCRSVEKKISSYGFCCRNRAFDAEPIVAYGASEMMRVWLESGLMDCAVVVSEGAGTVITQNGKLVQSIGARLTGIIKTSPIREVIAEIEAKGGVVLDSATAKIDQVEGVRKALQLGFRRVAVSVASFQAGAIGEIRSFESENNMDVLVFSVCNTCASEADLRHIARADIACASASTVLRTKIGRRALLQIGVTIPVYALTGRGKRLVLAYLGEFSRKLVAFRTSKLPYEVEGKDPRIRSQRIDQKP